LNCKQFFARLAITACFLSLGASFASGQTKGSSEARTTVQKFFDLLKAQQYAALYDYLPAELQRQLTREQLTQRLKRLEEFIVIERLEVGRVQQRGDFAVIDTVLYGRLKRPLTMGNQKIEFGKVAVQQYLFKEGRQWKVITADNNTRAQFLRRYPEFSKGFQFTQPQFFVKQNGRWVAFG
jgi:hypothetical protein